MTGPGDEPVGSLGEELAKLLHTLAGGPDSDLREAAATAWKQAGEQIEHSSECRYCPWCRGVRAVLDTPPEVRAQLAVAAAALAQAAATLLSPHLPEDATDRRGPVEHIDLEQDQPDQSSGGA